MNAVIQDYEANMELDDIDPTDPFESVEKEFMDKLGGLLVAAQDALGDGDAEVTINEDFYMKRGEFLDLLLDAQVMDWLRWMRLQNRVPFRTYEVGD